jgi:ADP-ribosyl-[dinitrogen reductase] hydrolase
MRLTKPEKINKAAGAIIGAMIGDAVGLTWEFRVARDIPRGPYSVTGGGPFNFSKGAWSDDTDLLMCSLGGYGARGTFSAPVAVGLMLDWYEALPKDVGSQTSAALVQHTMRWRRKGAAGIVPLKTDAEAQGNGALMRIMAHAFACDDPLTAVNNAVLDTRMTHPSEVACKVSAFYTATLWHMLRGWPADLAQGFARSSLDIPLGCKDTDFLSPYETYEQERGGWCVHSLRLALYAAQAAHSYEEGIAQVIRTGGDTDTNACIAGALLGARFGRDAIPDRWTRNIIPVLMQQINGQIDRLMVG